MEASWILGGVSLILNCLVLTMQSRITAEVSALRAHVYERFITKDDLSRLMPR